MTLKLVTETGHELGLYSLPDEVTKFILYKKDSDGGYPFSPKGILGVETLASSSYIGNYYFPVTIDGKKYAPLRQQDRHLSLNFKNNGKLSYTTD